VKRRWKVIEVYKFVGRNYEREITKMESERERETEVREREMTKTKQITQNIAAGDAGVVGGVRSVSVDVFVQYG